MGVRKMVYGVGLNDWPTPVVFNKKIIPEYDLWRSMLYRCLIVLVKRISNSRQRKKHIFAQWLIGIAAELMKKYIWQ